MDAFKPYFQTWPNSKECLLEIQLCQYVYSCDPMTVTLKLADAPINAQTRRALADVSLSVAKNKRIVVITGAGISCSCGIPVGN